MYKMRIVLASFALLVAQQVFAETTTDATDSDSKPCRAVAMACKAAGYSRHHANKRFWKDCMRPVMMGQTVNGVKLDADTVKACRVAKIEAIKKQLQELQSVSN